MRLIYFILLLSLVTQYSISANTPIIPGDSLTVYIFLSEDCVISQNYTLTLNQMAAEFKSRHIGFAGIFPNTWSKDSTINNFKIKYSVNYPLKTDHSKTLTNKFGITVTPEVAVWSHSSETLIYRGKIDNLYERIGRRRQKATSSELRDVLNNWLQNKNISFSETKAVGCFINLKN